MSPEEAAEEILRGPYAECTHCRGTGLVFDVESEDWNSVYCKSCEGSGQWRRGDYVTACVLLGKEVPPIPKKRYLPEHGFINREAFEKALQNIYQPNQFVKEYMGVWPAREERDDTVDALKYAMTVRSNRIPYGAITQMPQYKVDTNRRRKP
jgi:hypothetical protein